MYTLYALYIFITCQLLIWKLWFSSDVNMASEPKPNRPNRKRPQGAGAEW